MLHFFKDRSLKSIILLFVILIQVITAGSIITFSYLQTLKSILTSSEKLLHEAVISNVKHMSKKISSIETAVKMVDYIVKDISDISVKNRSLTDYCVAVVTQFPELESVFIGTETSVFLQVKVVSPGMTYRMSPKLLSNKSKYAIRFLDQAKDARQEIWTYLDSEGNTVDSEILPTTTFDPKTRPWYQQTIEKGGTIWTDIYTFSTTQEKGIACGQMLINAQTGSTIGVMGADIPIKHFTSMLKDTNFPGVSFIITKSGDLLTSNINTKVDHELESNKSLIQEAFQHQLAIKNEHFNFEHANEDYLVNFTNFTESMFPKWQLGFIVSEDYFLGSLKKTQLYSILLSLGILMASLALIIFLVQRVSGFIQKLADQANQITQFDLNAPHEVTSGITEIQMLQQALSKMRNSIFVFGKFVPKNLVKKLLHRTDPVKIEGKIKKVTLLFTDIAGFTTISESYPPDKLMQHLSHYFEELTTIIHGHNGTIDKFIGDAIMALWGAPQADRDHALHACQTALLCQRRLFDLNRQWHFEKKPPLPTRIGIHTGDAIVGTLGSSERFNYTALGDNVNLAARLEGLNKFYGTSIIISDTVFHLMRNYAIVRPLDLMTVKGKEKPIEIFELVALQNSDPLLIPTEEQLLMVKNFAKAMQSYRDQRFEEAYHMFDTLEQAYPQDKVSKIYKDRSDYYIKNPPPPEWEGVYHHDSK